MHRIKWSKPLSFLTLALVIYAGPALGATEMNALASYKRFGQEQFIVGVFSELGKADETAILKSSGSKALELRIVDDRIFPRRFQRMWIEGLAINCSDGELEKHASSMANFSNMLNVQLRAGDIFRIERTAPDSTVVKLNGTPLGKIEDGAFFDLLLRSWIGAVPLSAELKESLQAEGDTFQSLRGRFASITPSSERSDAVASAIAARDQTVAKAPSPTQKKPSAPATPEPGAEAVAVADAGNAAQIPKPLASVSPSPGTPASPASKSSEVPEGMTVLDNDTVVLPASAETAVSAAGILLEQRYISQLTKWTQRFAKYPKRALRRNQEGTVQVTVTLNRNGALTDVQLAEESRHQWLNEAAKEAVESASPFPPMPAELVDDEFQFTMPVVFKLF